MEMSSHPYHDPSLLSPRFLDEDVSSSHSDRSDQDTDSEDDKLLQTIRMSADIRAHDQSVLIEEEELDQLLINEKRNYESPKSALGPVQGSLQALLSHTFTKSRSDVRDKKSRRKKREVKKRKINQDEAKVDEEEYLMAEMEEGALKTESSTRSSSDEEESDKLDRRRLVNLLQEKKRKSWRTWCLSHLLIAIGCSILVVLVWKISLKKRDTQNLMSNGTALFAPTTILVSLDGFRADYLQWNITPRLSALIEEGVSPPYMQPSFPSLTFPNHFTLVTGLNPESHGIIGNNFWDDRLKEEFYYRHADAMDSKWWRAEPIWVTAENNGIKTAIHMWPGSEAIIKGTAPTYVDKFNEKFDLTSKANRVLEFLDMSGYESDDTSAHLRPQLIAAYVPNVDVDGHRYGPNSTEIQTSISDVDNMLNIIFMGLEQRNLTEIVNIVVVSDHGMATTDITRMIQLDDLVDPESIEHLAGWPLCGIHPKGDVHELFKKLSDVAAINSNFDVYLRDENMPIRYHFSNNHRIAPLWIVPKTGWMIVSKKDFDIEDAKNKNMQYHPRGVHGYDNENPLMRAIFVAKGPAFSHTNNSRLKSFKNLEVYNIICDTLGLKPLPNNGTVRLSTLPINTDNPPDTINDDTKPATNLEHGPKPSSTTADAPSQGLSCSSQEPSCSPQPISTSSSDELLEAAHLSGIDTEWMSDKQKELLGWMKSNTEWLKSWWKMLTSDTD